MDSTPPPVPSRSPAAAGGAALPALAIASLVLGILGLVLSVVVVGAVLPLVGLILGAIHLRRASSGRGVAWAGVWTSIVALVASAGFAAFFVTVARDVVRTARLQPASGFESWVGKPAPDIEVKTLDNRTLRLSELKGRRVILDFWATWCGPCVMEIPHFSQLHREAPADDLVILGISKEGIEVLTKFVAARGVPYPIALSPAGLPEPYSQITGIPTSFFIDRVGVIRHVAVGYRDFESLRALADRLNAEESPAPTGARP